VFISRIQNHLDQTLHSLVSASDLGLRDALSQQLISEFYEQARKDMLLVEGVFSLLFAQTSGFTPLDLPFQLLFTGFLRFLGF